MKNLSLVYDTWTLSISYVNREHGTATLKLHGWMDELWTTQLPQYLYYRYTFDCDGRLFSQQQFEPLSVDFTLVVRLCHHC